MKITHTKIRLEQEHEPAQPQERAQERTRTERKSESRNLQTILRKMSGASASARASARASGARASEEHTPTSASANAITHQQERMGQSAKSAAQRRTSATKEEC